MRNEGERDVKKTFYRSFPATYYYQSFVTMQRFKDGLQSTFGHHADRSSASRVVLVSQ